ncbi:MAG: FAD-dependent oxidoreductase [Candidatus Omnitrophica bacterium]|nr:FAD-dependent oxidoreductase [Candidatus Omnitrophota bacterium]
MKGIKVLSLGPGFRKGELFVEIQTEKTGITDTRIKFPEVIAFLRDRFEFLKESLVSHISQEPLVIKTKSPQSFSNPIKNLFPAIFFNTEKPDTTLLDLRLEAGIRIGKHLKRSNRCFPDDIERFDCEKYPWCDEEFDFDVVVTGGGTAGAVAAIASAREGAKTAVVEHSTCLGGLGTGGGVHHYYLGLGGGIQKEIEERSTELTNLFRGKFNISGWHPEAKKIVLEEMCSAAGVKIFYQNCFVDVEMKNSRISAIHCVTPCGKIKYSAQVFVDATGDADVAVKAGTPYTLGRNRDRIPQPFTLVPMKLIPDGSLIHINFDSGFVDPTDVVDLSRAKRESLGLFERRIKNEVDIPLYICPILGIRQGRQILGKHTLTLMDEILGTRFPDSISSMSSHYDNHSKDMENQSYHALIWRWLTDNHLTRLECEIPYRCLLPLNVEGLLVTGRAISLEPEAHYALRMEKDMERIGEVAGIAASICVKKGLFPSNIDIAELQEKLKKSGCWDPEYNVKPAIDLKKPQHVLKQKFFNKDFKEPVSLWAFFLSKETENFLNSALRSKTSDNEVKFWSAVILAIHGKKQGLRTLLNYLGTKRNINSPLYISLIVILGKLKEKEALHFLHDIIFDKTAGVDTIIAAIRAIGEIGSKKSIKTIEKFIKRKEKPHTRILSEGRKGFIKRVQEDILWQIELACAETLKTLGKPYKEIVAKYLNDPRKYVRNYAETIC